MKSKESRLFGLGLSDIIESIRQSDIAFYLAWSDTKARYKRSVIGPFWVSLGTAIGVAGLGWLWSILLKVNRESFIPSLTAGLIIWQLIASCILESTNLFQRQGGIIRNLKVPYFIHPMQLVFRQFVNFFHNSIVYIAVAIIFTVPVNWNTLLLIPGLMIVFFNLLWIVLLISILGVRFRDIEFIVASLMPLLFFVSPVLYRPNYLPIDSNLIWLNPLSYFIEIIRDPLLGISPPSLLYIITLIMLVIGWIITLLLFGASKKRIAFWV